jgi:hypothetical protein
VSPGKRRRKARRSFTRGPASKSANRTASGNAATQARQTVPAAATNNAPHEEGAPQRQTGRRDLRARYETFWCGMQVSDAKLSLFRFLFFGVVAVDAWLQIVHGPRYGAADFNVAHFPVLDALLPIPTRPVVLTVFLLQAYLAARVALGVGGRASIALLTALFGYGYFISQLNSYQHHYLIFLLLVCTCFFTRDPAKSWPIRLILVQISIVYLWAAVAKLDPLWLNGTTLDTGMSLDSIRGIVEGTVGWPTVAILTVVLELFLMVAIHIRRTRIVAFVIGAGFHISIEGSGFAIGLFSYFMLALYVLLIPDDIASFVVKPFRFVWARLSPETTALDQRAVVGAVVVSVGLVVGTLLLLLLPFEDDVVAIALIAALGATSGAMMFRNRKVSAPSFTKLAVSHVGACALLLILALDTNTARDYHRFWGGSLRRMGQLEEAVKVYERAVRIAPTHAPSRTSLGNLYRRTDRVDEALDEYKRALAINPGDWRPNLGAAMIYDLQNDGPAALAHAENVLRYQPNNREALSIVNKRSYNTP